MRGDRRLVPVGEGPRRADLRGVGGRQRVLGREPLRTRLGHLGQRGRDLGDPPGVHFERAEVGVREVAIVHRLFLRPHRLRRARARLEEARLLHDRPARREHGRLPRDLVLERLLHVRDRVQVLDLDLHAERGVAVGTEGHVRVAAQRAFFHVPVRGVHPAHEAAQPHEVVVRLVGRGEVRLRDDLDERRSRAVQVDERRGRRDVVPWDVVHGLSRVLLEVNAVQADLAPAGVRLDGDAASRRERALVLGDLIALREVGVEVVLPFEDAAGLDRAAGREGDAQRERHHLAVRDRQRAGIAEADRADGGVRRRAERHGARAERLALRLELRVHLEPDHRLERGRRHERECSGAPSVERSVSAGPARSSRPPAATSGAASQGRRARARAQGGRRSTSRRAPAGTSGRGRSRPPSGKSRSTSGS